MNTLIASSYTEELLLKLAQKYFYNSELTLVGGKLYKKSGVAIPDIIVVKKGKRYRLESISVN